MASQRDQDGFARLRSLVLRDDLLQQRLCAVQNWSQLATMCAALADELGFSLAHADLEQARITVGSPLLEGAARNAAPAPGYDDVPGCGWTPVDFAMTAVGPVVEWADLRGLEFDEPFLEGTVRRALGNPYRRLFRPRTPIAALAVAASQAESQRPNGLILHSSRCGSTLVCRLLAQLSDVVVLSEPGPCDRVLRTPGVDEATRATWLQWMVAALARRQTGVEQRVVVKLDAWATRYLPVIRRAFPDVPWVFVYREPAAVIASQRRQPGRPGAPGLLPPQWFGLDLPQALALAPEDYCARVVATICEQALAHLDDGGRLLAYDELPQAIWTEVLEHFGLVEQTGDRARMRTAALRDAKRPYETFDPTAAARTVTPAAQEAANRWAGDVYARLQARRSDQTQAAHATC